MKPLQAQPQKKNSEVPQIDDVQFIQKNNGLIKGYSVNTFHGRAKNYNQDRVSIIMNITKPNYKGKWPQCSYFAVFDGHGGNACSDYLKDEMHKFITENEYFPTKPIQALKEGFKKAEQQFLRLAQLKNPVERSGSCALVLLIIDQTCYVANVGDCRIVLSASGGKHVYPVSKDHKPDSETQRVRIYEAGGKIYQSCVKAKNGSIIHGPHRIDPGKLSVSRSFGDIEAKYPKYGGNPKVLIAKPQITYFNIHPQDHDFLMMGSDGIFDKMQNQQIVNEFWKLQEQSVRKNQGKGQKAELEFIGKAASRVITKAMENMSLDNLTTLFIVFEDHGKLRKQQNLQQHINNKIITNNGREKNCDQITAQNIKQKRMTSSSSNTHDQQQQQSQFAIRRQNSKVRFQDLSKPAKQLQITQKQKQRHKQKTVTSLMKPAKDFSDGSTQVRRKRSMHQIRYQPHSQQNQQQQNKDEQNRGELANRMMAQPQNNQNQGNDSSNSGKYGILQKNIDAKLGTFGQLKRKKSQGILKKQSKEPSVWSTISRGQRKDEKIQKIRY